MAGQQFDTPITTTDQSIDRVLGTELPVLLVAVGGSLKRRVQHTMKKLAEAYAGQMLVVKIQIDENPQTAKRFELNGGGVLSFRNGAEIGRTKGTPNESVLQEHAAFLVQDGPEPTDRTAEGAPAQAAPIPVTDATFERDVIQNDMPVLVDFWAPWCGPCRMIAPTVEKLASEYAGRLHVAKVNTDENPRWAQHYQIRGIPTLLLFKGGEVIDRLVGMQPEPMLRAAVERALLMN